jgi:8-oxo-dGTP pyrophosphatase MutT (NUDIX family)
MRKAAGCFITNESGDVLCFIRSDPQSLGAGLPCGGVDGDESFEDAAIREVLEETGYTVVLDNIPPFEDIEEGDNFHVMVFSASIKGKISATHAHEGAPVWANSSLLLSGPYASFNKKMIEHFREYISFN